MNQYPYDTLTLDKLSSDTNIKKAYHTVGQCLLAIYSVVQNFYKNWFQNESFCDLWIGVIIFILEKYF